MDQSTIINNLKKCPHFDRCSFNFCPLDLELGLRTGSNFDKCKWMREPRRTNIKGKEIITGGAVMPDALLNFVPRANVERLNETSRKRWFELNNY